MFSLSSTSLQPQNGIQRSFIGSKISTSSARCVFFGAIRKKQDGRPGLWLAELNSTFLQQQNRTEHKLERERDLNVISVTFVLFRPIGKPRWLPWGMINRDIFHFLSANAEQNLTESKILSTSYSEFFFGRFERKVTALVFDRRRHFRLLFCNRWTEFKESSQEARSNVLFQVCVFCFLGVFLQPRLKFQRLSDWAIFDFFSSISEWNSTNLDRMQIFNIFNQVCDWFEPIIIRMYTVPMWGTQVHDCGPLGLFLCKKEILIGWFYDVTVLN